MSFKRSGYCVLGQVMIILTFNLPTENRTRKSGYSTYRRWTQKEYQNKDYNINQKDEETWDDRGRDGGTNFILRIKE